MADRDQIKKYWLENFGEEASASEIAQFVRILRMVSLRDPFALMYAHFVRFYHIELSQREQAILKDGVPAHDLAREILDDYANLTNLMADFRVLLIELEDLTDRVSKIEKKWNGSEERRLFMQLAPAEVTKLGLTIYWLTPIVWTAIVTVVLFLPR